MKPRFFSFYDYRAIGSLLCLQKLEKCPNNSEELTDFSGNTADVFRTPISFRVLIIELSGIIR